MRVLLLFLAAHVYCEVQNNILKAHVNIIENSTTVQAVCESNNLNDAVAWITSPNIKLIPPDSVKNKFLKPLPFDWSTNGWNTEFAYKGLFGPVLDYTWEKFKIIQSNRELPRLKILNQFELNFSFLGKSNAEIQMCTAEDKKPKSCYFYIIHSTLVILQKCIFNVEKEEDSRQCITLKKTQYSPKFSNDRWSHITIRYYNEKLQIIIDYNILLSYSPSNRTEFNDYSIISCFSSSQDALWKYHEYNYFEARTHKNQHINSYVLDVHSENLCIFLATNFGKEISLKLISAANSVVISEKTYQSHGNTNWNFISFNSTTNKGDKYFLRIEYSQDDNVAIRNVVYTDVCDPDDSMFHKSTIQYNIMGDTENIKCASLRNENLQLAFQTQNASRMNYSVTVHKWDNINKTQFLWEPRITLITDNYMSISVSKGKVMQNSSVYVVVLSKQLGQSVNRKYCGNTPTLYIPEYSDFECQTIGYYKHSNITTYEDIEIVLNTSPAKFNCRIDECDFKLLIVDEFSNKSNFTWFPLSINSKLLIYDAKESPIMLNNYISGLNQWVFVMFLIIMGVMLIVGLIIKRRVTSTSRKKHVYTEIAEVDAPAKLNDDSYSDVPLLPIHPREMSKDKIISNVIKVDDLEEYTKEFIFSGYLQEQYTKIEGLTKNSTENPCSANTELKASFIDTPNCMNAYIMCSTPSKTNIQNFWQMIIDEHIENIILLASSDDIKKKYIIKYWPDFSNNDSIVFGDIKITSETVEGFLNYDVHNLKLKQGNFLKKIQLLHFKYYSELENPWYPYILKSFLECLQTVPHSSKHPILVHNSNNSGINSAVIIMVDVCLQQAVNNNQMDISHLLQTFRNQRENFIETYEEYLLIHLILIQYLEKVKHHYPSQNFSVAYSKIDDDTLDQHMKDISESMWQESVLQPESPVWFHNDCTKNRDQNIVANPSCAVFLRPLKEEESSYINAIFVDGYHQSKKFIATQHPLENTVDEFWRLVVDNNVKFIVSLQPDYDVVFWRKDEVFKTANGTTVEYVDTSKLSDFHMHTLNIQLQSGPNKEITVKFMELQGWSLDMDVPENMRIFITARLQMTRMKCTKFNSVLVMCRNGADGSGLYIAACNLIDSILTEQVVDVCMIVRRIRSNRTQFITNKKQLHALYEVATFFLSDFNKYHFVSTLPIPSKLRNCIG